MKANRKSFFSALFGQGKDPEMREVPLLPTPTEYCPTATTKDDCTAQDVEVVDEANLDYTNLNKDGSVEVVCNGNPKSTNTLIGGMEYHTTDKKRIIKDMVECVLIAYPETSSCDIALTIKVWQMFYGVKDSVPIELLYKIPREDRIKRVRAKFNEEGLYLPTDQEVWKRRNLEYRHSREGFIKTPFYLITKNSLNG